MIHTGNNESNIKKATASQWSLEIIYRNTQHQLIKQELNYNTPKKWNMAKYV